MSETTRETVSVPAQRKPAREVAIRELRNAGKVLAELTEADEVGKVTSGGQFVGWLVPADPTEQRVEELVAEGRLSGPPPGTLVGRRPRKRRADLPPLSQTLLNMREESN